LSQLQPLTTLEQFMFDVFLFHEPYTVAQYCGIGYLFMIYTIQGVKYVWVDLPKDRQRDDKKRAAIAEIKEESSIAQNYYRHDPGTMKTVRLEEI